MWKPNNLRNFFNQAIVALLLMSSVALSVPGHAAIHPPDTDQGGSIDPEYGVESYNGKALKNGSNRRKRK